jgi:hypothetical protein
MVVILRDRKPIAYTEGGEEIELTADEYLYYKALKRLEKYRDKQGRLHLFSHSGSLNIELSEKRDMDKVHDDDVIDTINGLINDGGDP